MQTTITIDDQQLNKLLFYTHAKNGTEAITQIIQDYLLQKDKLNNQPGRVGTCCSCPRETMR